MRRPIAACSAILLAIGLAGGAALAQQPERPSALKRISLSSLTAQGFEVKAVTAREALIVQKDKEVYWCTLRLANSAPLSYQSECYSVR